MFPSAGATLEEFLDTEWAEITPDLLRWLGGGNLGMLRSAVAAPIRKAKLSQAADINTGTEIWVIPWLAQAH